VVPNGSLTEGLSKLHGLQLIINEEYARRTEELQVLARTTTYDAGNPFFRMLQIMAHLRKRRLAAARIPIVSN
jgi:hypothetical protein